MRRWTRDIVAENIARIRYQRNLTQKRLAEMIGWESATSVRRIEEGSQGMNLDTLDNIADALKVHPIELIKDWSE